jgi:alkaline phosphatase D
MCAVGLGEGCTWGQSTGASQTAAGPARSLVAPQGVAIGEVGPKRAVLWSRARASAIMHVRVRGPQGPVRGRTRVRAEDDFAGQVELRGLTPAAEHRYEVWFTGPDQARSERGRVLRGAFRTAPKEASKRAVRLAWSGDLGGQNVCRHAEQGYPVFRAMRRADPDLFVGLGDMIYADLGCEGTGRYGNPQVPSGFGPALDVEGFWAHWRYNRVEPGLRALLAETPYYGVWDDHEVINDFGPDEDVHPLAPARHLMPLGRRAWFDYNPIPAPEDRRMYRSVRWGKHLQLLVLDTRSYRDPSGRADTKDEPKTMLGADQKAWLEQQLRATDATWVVVVSSVPISIPTGAGGEDGRDGWASGQTRTGYERELESILRQMRRTGIENGIWITTDVHHATGIRYTPFAGDEKFTVHEFVAGPLNAGLGSAKELDGTFHPERLFAHAPKIGPKSWEQARRWFNFGLLTIDESGGARVSIRNANGQTVAEHRLQRR